MIICQDVSYEQLLAVKRFVQTGYISLKNFNSITGQGDEENQQQNGDAQPVKTEKDDFFAFFGVDIKTLKMSNVQQDNYVRR